MTEPTRHPLARFDALRNSPAPFISLVGGQNDTTYSFAEVHALARGFAAALAGAQGQVTFIVLHHGLECYAAFIGAMMAGSIPSFLPHPSAKQEPKHWAEIHHAVFARAGAAAVITYVDLLPDIEGFLRGSSTRVIVAATVAPAVGLADALDLPAQEAIALLQHSSGTTGLKKGVALSFAAIMRQLDAYAEALGLGAEGDEVIASWLPLYHDMGLVSSFLLPLYRGARIVAMDPFAWVSRPAMLLEAIERHRATHCWMPNFAFMHLVRAVPRRSSHDLGSMQMFVSCSEPCKPEAFDAFLARYGGQGVNPSSLTTCYAMAETVFAVSQPPARRAPRVMRVDPAAVAAGDAVADREDGLGLLSNGPPLPGVRLEIRHAGRALPERKVGEICVAAPFLFDGYFRNPDATREALRDGWYHTGDLGFVDGGEVFILGRIKDLIIVNGRNLYAHDVEMALASVAGLKPGRSVAFGHYDARIGSEALVVVAEVDPAATASPTHLTSEASRRLQERLGIAAADIRVVPPGWLVKTTSGKISRSDNQEKYMRTLLAGEGNA